jgi:hypothetical protein
VDTIKEKKENLIKWIKILFTHRNGNEEANKSRPTQDGLPFEQRRGIYFILRVGAHESTEPYGLTETLRSNT